MSTRSILIMVLLLIPASLSDAAKIPCEIPSVEEGDNATFTISFGKDVSIGRREFVLFHQPRVKPRGLYDQRMLQCEFSYGKVECEKTSCCTWERRVEDVFRVYIHSVSQEHEGEYWIYLLPSTTIIPVPCNFTFKAPTCSKDSISAINGQVVCSAQSINIGQTCTVTCHSDIPYQGNQSSVTYTCVGKNEWSPEVPITSCEVSTQNQANGHLSTTDFSTTEKRNGTPINKVLGSDFAVLVTIAILSANY